jgi:hypothetical protein
MPDPPKTASNRTIKRRERRRALQYQPLHLVDSRTPPAEIQRLADDHRPTKLSRRAAQPSPLPRPPSPDRSELSHAVAIADAARADHRQVSGDTRRISFHPSVAVDVLSAPILRTIVQANAARLADRDQLIDCLRRDLAAARSARAGSGLPVSASPSLSLPEPRSASSARSDQRCSAGSSPVPSGDVDPPQDQDALHGDHLAAKDAEISDLRLQLAELREHSDRFRADKVASFLSDGRNVFDCPPSPDAQSAADSVVSRLPRPPSPRRPSPPPRLRINLEFGDGLYSRVHSRHAGRVDSP